MKMEKLVREIEITLAVILVLLVIAYLVVPYVLSIMAGEATAQSLISLFIVIAVLLLLLAFAVDEIMYLRKKK